MGIRTMGARQSTCVPTRERRSAQRWIRGKAAMLRRSTFPVIATTVSRGAHIDDMSEAPLSRSEAQRWRDLVPARLPPRVVGERGLSLLRGILGQLLEVF